MLRHAIGNRHTRILRLLLLLHVLRIGHVILREVAGVHATATGHTGSSVLLRHLGLLVDVFRCFIDLGSIDTILVAADWFWRIQTGLVIVRRRLLFDIKCM